MFNSLKMHNQLQLIGLLGFIATGCLGVKITNLKVPRTYTIEDPMPTTGLILDCEYELGTEETGFVLKWLFNDHSIYQWIPSHKPHALSFMKGRVDLSYAVSKDKYYKHRALFITKPTWNMTGEYTCHVQTFQSSDKRSAHLQVIVPETDFQLNHNVDDDGLVNIQCSANDVYPEPKVAIVLGEDDPIDTQTATANRGENGLFDFVVERKLPKEDLESPTAINCILSLPGTNYTKKRETIFYDQATTSTTEPQDDVDKTSASSRLEADQHGNSSSSVKMLQFTSFTVVIILCKLVSSILV